MKYTSEDLATYYSALSLPKDIIKTYVNMIDKMLRNNGVEFTVNRQKEIYVDFVRYRAGLPPVGRWYKKNKSGLPYGILSRIFKLGTRKKYRFSCSTLLRSYTRFISKDSTKQQISKFLTGVTSPIRDLPDQLSDGVCSTSLRVIGQYRTPYIRRPSFISYSPSPGKRVPDCWGFTYPEETHWPFQWETLEQTKTGVYLRRKYSDIFSSVMSGICALTRGNSSWEPAGIDSVGKIGLIQEPGLKLRAVANPNRIYQVALTPLANAIEEINIRSPWDCTFDQKKAIPAIQEHLRKGKKAHCIDLTGATDYFPLKLQIDVLKCILPDYVNDIDLFQDLSTSPWIFQDTTIVWTRGQPLGLRPSFASFALTHGLLLLHLNKGIHNNEFFVLGDDVVIMNDKLALSYLNCLGSLDCPISTHKSLSSIRMAEFGGKLIFEDFVEPQLKWRQLSDDNFIDILKLLGPKGIRLLRPQQRKVAKAIWDIPDFLGGVGFNPHGLPLKDRYEKYLTLFGKDDGTFLMSYDRKFSSFFMSEWKSPSNCVLSQFWDGSRLPDLDQRSAALVSKYLPLFSEMYDIMGTNLYSVSLDKGVLPINGFAGSRQTLLAQLQRKLR